MPTKPTKEPIWAHTTPANIVEPSTAKKNTGWIPDEKPPSQYFNWWMDLMRQWKDYFEEVTDLNTQYDVVVGTGATATHATLQAAVNDAGLGTNLRVLVLDNASISTKVSLTKAGWRIFFSPGVVYTKDGATVGLSLENDYIEIHGGRFVGWTTGGDKAMELTVNADYCLIFGSIFGASTATEVDDSAVGAGKKPAITGTRTEV